MDEKSLRVLEYNVVKEILLKYCSSELGKEIVKELMPVDNISKVLEMLEETTQAKAALVKRGNVPLGGLSDIRHSLKKASMGAILAPGELLNIGDVFRVARGLKKYSSDVREHDKLPIIDGLIEKLITSRQVEEEINNAIISEDELSDSASSTLKNIRRQIIDTNSSIKERLNSIIHSAKYQKYLQENLITMRDGRYVVPVKQEYRSNIQGLVHDSSSTGATLFIEPMAVVDANNKLKELIAKEKVEIEIILSKLTELIVNNIDILNKDIYFLSLLDFIFAKGKLSFEYECTNPQVNDKGYINLIKARHPLIDKSKVVPIDIELGNNINTLVITGPNTGGKTVTLKTVGLFTLMAQSGLHIPVKDGSEISVFSNVFADIGDEQSIEQSLSTFSSHMTNIVHILQNAGFGSLCLFDELGAGTDPTEGAALAMSILSHLNEINAQTIATTHYSELKMFALTNRGFQNASCEFDVETLKPTYRVLMGIPGKSNAFEISKRLGLSDQIISDARKYISQEDIHFEDVINNLHKEWETAKKERDEASVYKREMEILKHNIEKQNKEFEEKKKTILIEARQQALQILDDAKAESQEILNEMREIVKVQQQQERERLFEEANQKLRKVTKNHENEISKTTFERKSESKPPKTVKVGQIVHILNLDVDGTVLSLPDSNGNVQVQAGIIKLNSNLKDLRIKDEEEVKNKEQASRFSSSKSIDISPEIDVRGAYLDDALVMIDKYIDDAFISGLSVVTIIHGKGTGVLRTGIQKFLKENKHVGTFRLGRYGEGDAGVTIVELV